MSASGLLGQLLRRSRLRGLVEGLVQRVRAESLEHDAKDDAERFQDYGFTANAVDGQGLVLNVGGHTIVLRMDRLAERPQLPAYEVAVWHREGHMVRLKAGKVVQISCDHLVVDAAADVVINSPSVTVNASTGVTLATPQVTATEDVTVGGTATAAVDVVAAGISLVGHTHGNVDNGPGFTHPPASA